ncbi:MAG: hypothetical protein KGZ69_00660 [Methylomonas sp.]|nr:hypothetical protein [Methylomonas sp.]
MQRCPLCSARLSEAPVCPRCGTELHRVLRSGRLAKAWLSVSLQTLHAGRADVAVLAIRRSLSFKQTPEAKLLKGFLIRRQYRALYQSLGQQNWREARGILDGLRALQGDSETLLRFAELVGYLSFQSNENRTSEE